MPDITVTVTNQQAQRIAAAFGPQPEGSTLTAQQWVVLNTKALLKERVKQFEAATSSNAAFDASRAQTDLDFNGF